jgi:hypothetical protein
VLVEENHFTIFTTNIDEHAAAGAVRAHGLCLGDDFLDEPYPGLLCQSHPCRTCEYGLNGNAADCLL